MSRYIVLASLDPRNIPSYYIVDTSDNSRVRCYDCELWARHRADALNRESVQESRRDGNTDILHPHADRAAGERRGQVEGAVVAVEKMGGGTG